MNLSYPDFIFLWISVACWIISNHNWPTLKFDHYFNRNKKFRIVFGCSSFKILSNLFETLLQDPGGAYLWSSNILYSRQQMLQRYNQRQRRKRNIMMNPIYCHRGWARWNCSVIISYSEKAVKRLYRKLLTDPLAELSLGSRLKRENQYCTHLSKDNPQPKIKRKLYFRWYQRIINLEHICWSTETVVFFFFLFWGLRVCRGVNDVVINLKRF